MRPHLLALAPLLAACSGSSGPPPEPTDLTAGVAVQLAPACGYSFSTPNETTAPIADDGQAAIGAPRAIHTTWAGDPSTTMVVQWATDIASHGTRIQFGAGTALDQSASGFSFSYPTDLSGLDPPSVRVHQVHLCGLQPGTAYGYQVAGTSVAGHFATAPNPGQPVRFAVLGDSRGAAATFGPILADAATRGVDFVLYLGDAVTLGSIQGDWDAFFDATPTLAELPLEFVMGNHEDNQRHYFSQFALPGNEQWYSFDYGDAHFTVLDDTPKVDATIEGDQATFLAADLAATQRAWKLTAHHKSIYSSADHPSANGQPDPARARLAAAWSPIYDAQGVAVDLASHDHGYERTMPIKAGMVQPAPATVYLVNGGAGADLYSFLGGAQTAFSKSTTGYSVIDLSPTQLTTTFYEVAGGPGTVLDTATLTK